MLVSLLLLLPHFKFFSVRGVLIATAETRHPRLRHALHREAPHRAAFPPRTAAGAAAAAVRAEGDTDERAHNLGAEEGNEL